jgi:hypothetical protein
MSVKEELHRLVDTLPEDEAARLLRDLQDAMDDEPLSSADLASIDHGLEDLRVGRSISLAELKRNTNCDLCGSFLKRS